LTNCSRAGGCAGSNYPFLTQKERDIETGLDYFLARYYSPTQGRFTSPDEFTGGPDELYSFVDDASDNPTFYADLGNPQSLNKYQYAYNNPLRYIDLDGHDPLEPPQDPVTTIVVATKIVAVAETVVVGTEAAVVAGGAAAVAGVTAGVEAAAKGIKVGAQATLEGVKAGVDATARSAKRVVDGVKNSVDSLSGGGQLPDRIPKDQRAKKPGRKVREEVYSANKEKNGGGLKCDICGDKMERSGKDRSGVTPKPNSATIDHTHPRSRGGSSDKENLRGACRKCNRAKSDND